MLQVKLIVLVVFVTLVSNTYIVQVFEDKPASLVPSGPDLKIQNVQLVVDCKRTLSTADGRMKAKMNRVCQQEDRKIPYITATVGGNCGYVTLQANPNSSSEEVYVLVEVYTYSNGNINVVSYDINWYNTTSNQSGMIPVYHEPNTPMSLFRKNDVNPGGLGDVIMRVDHLFAIVDYSMICIGLRPTVSFYNSW